MELTSAQKAEAAFDAFIVDRWYVRCVHCLSVAAIEESPARNLKCSLCKGPIENMGRVHRDRLLEDRVESVCDARCTSARGPKCVCHCCTANHGSGRVVTVTRDIGEEPLVNMPTSEEAKEIAAEYIAAVSKVQARISEFASKRKTGIYNYQDNYQIYIGHRAVSKAAKLRMHPARMKTLNGFLQVAA